MSPSAPPPSSPADGSAPPGDRPTPSSAEPAADALPRIRPKAPARVQFASTILILEALVVLFGALVAHGLRDVPSAWPSTSPVLPAAAIWAIGGSLAVVLLVLSRMMRVPGGFLAGSLVQIPVLATGLAVPMMFVAGGVFAVLWAIALRLGARIDAERAAYDAAHPDEAPNVV